MTLPRQDQTNSHPAEEDAPLDRWLEALIRSVSEIADAFGLGRLTLPSPQELPRGLQCAFVSLLGDERSFEVGIGSHPQECHRLACAFAGISPEGTRLSDADVDDALGEMANMAVGGLKTHMACQGSALVIGLPSFAEGRFRKASSEQLTVHVDIGGVPVWLILQRFPSAPEVKAQRKAERELRMAHEQLRAFAELLREVFGATPEGLVVADGHGVVESANPAALALLGCAEAELVGQPLATLFDTQEPGSALEELSGERTLGIERICRTRAGARVPALVSSSPIRETDGSLRRIVCVFTDLRERRRLELELRQAQKLEAVGRLAAGIAHEINTPTQFVSDSIHFLREATESLLELVGKYRALDRAAMDRAAAAELSAAEQEVDLDFLMENVPPAFNRSLEGLDRIAGIVRSMKEFAHPDVHDKTPVDINQAIRNTLLIASHEYKYFAEIDTELGDLPQVVCHPGELNQVLVNLVVNAAHAIEDVVRGTDSKGRIAILTRREGDDAVICIRDTGRGIPLEIRERVFDPFFTTKEVGRGTGQGLAIARSVIVDKHQGAITFESEVGKGTTFCVRLPIGR